MILCTKKIEFQAGHRITQHGGKCRKLHGHRYIAEVSFASETLDSMGMVVDFDVIKSTVSEWIMSNWDHNLILYEKDRVARKRNQLLL